MDYFYVVIDPNYRVSILGMVIKKRRHSNFALYMPVQTKKGNREIVFSAGVGVFWAKMIFLGLLYKIIILKI